MARSRLDELKEQVEQTIVRAAKSNTAPGEAMVARDAFTTLKVIRREKSQARAEIRSLEELESLLLDAMTTPDEADKPKQHILVWIWEEFEDGDFDRWVVAAKGRELGLSSTNYLFGTQVPMCVKTGERTGKLTERGAEIARSLADNQWNN